MSQDSRNLDHGYRCRVSGRRVARAGREELMRMDREDILLRSDVDQILGLRHYLYLNPELSNQEFGVQSKIQGMLAENGLKPSGLFHERGFYIDIVGKKQDDIGRNIALRGDIDALFIDDGYPDMHFRFRNPGTLHTCRDNVHASIAFGTTLVLHRNRHTFSGKVRVIFQPAGEAEPIGGRAVVNDGLLTSFDCALGFRVRPEVESGRFGVLPGAVTKSSDQFVITVRGRQGHGAFPHKGIDAVSISAAMINELQKLVSRESDPNDAAVITVGRLNEGSALNVICGGVKIGGDIRTRSPDGRAQLCLRISEIAAQVASAHRGSAVLKLARGAPPVVNDLTLADVVGSAIRDAFGEAALQQVCPLEASDDFGFYSEAVPSVYFWLGCRKVEENNMAHLHTPKVIVSDHDVINSTKALLAVMNRLQGAPS